MQDTVNEICKADHSLTHSQLAYIGLSQEVSLVSFWLAFLDQSWEITPHLPHIVPRCLAYLHLTDLPCMSLTECTDNSTMIR